ncbi:hypothetical protein [Rathayibacter toxicus]|nr:hypothetical protein [Rathayibacter toxicus]QOD08357.1 hypothetical protein AYW78_00220 [Rathayibacter toxicus]QOD10475.1 hypothetical protein BSG36_00225 [Rathayibacter toxicus]
MVRWITADNNHRARSPSASEKALHTPPNNQARHHPGIIAAATVGA